MRIWSMVVAVVLAGICAPESRAGGQGTSFAEPLRLLGTTRNLGMGEAQVALADGIGAISANPACLTRARLPALHLTHTFQVADLSQDYLAYAQPLLFGQGFGMSLGWLYAGSTPRTMEDAQGNYAGEAGRYSTMFGAASAGWGSPLAGIVGLDVLRPAAGIGIRAFGQQVDNDREASGCLDAGITITPLIGLSLGAVLQNAGPSRNAASLPRQWIVGAGWEAAPALSGNDAVGIELDVVSASDVGTRMRAGLEYSFMVGTAGIALRGGWRQGIEVPGGGGTSGGFGFRQQAGMLPWGLDYAIMPFGEFGAIQSVALTVGFRPAP